MTHTEEICLHRVSLERAVSFFQEEPSDAEEIVSLVLGEPGFCRFDDQDFGLLIDALQTTTNIIYSVRIYAGALEQSLSQAIMERLYHVMGTFPGLKNLVQASGCCMQNLTRTLTGARKLETFECIEVCFDGTPEDYMWPLPMHCMPILH